MDHGARESAPGRRTVTGTVPFTRESRFELELPAIASATASAPLVVALHGFGESGARLSERLRDVLDAGCAVLCPDGPFPVEMRSEAPPRIGYAWYQYTGDAAQFAESLAETGAFLDRVIEAVVREHPVDPTRIVLLGYSQGGYLAGVHALAHPHRFAGLVAIATRIKTELFSAEELSRVRFPVLAIHGEKDPATPIDRQRESIEALHRAGVDAKLIAHAGGHGLRREAVAAMIDDLRRIVATR